MRMSDFKCLHYCNLTKLSEKRLTQFRIFLMIYFSGKPSRFTALSAGESFSMPPVQGGLISCPEMMLQANVSLQALEHHRVTSPQSYFLLSEKVWWGLLRRSITDSLTLVLGKNKAPDLADGSRRVNGKSPSSVTCIFLDAFRGLIMYIRLSRFAKYLISLFSTHGVLVRTGITMF